MIAACTLYILILFLSIIGCLYINKTVNNRDIAYPLYWIFFLFLVLFTTLRSPELPDYQEYMYLFNSTYSDSSDDKEASFYIICSIAKFLSPNDGRYLFLFIYALLGIGLKLYAIKKYSPHIIFSLCIWLSSFFILHDLIQIRAGVASGLFLLLLPELKKGNRIKSIIIFVIAFCFHYSAIVFLPFFFINPNRIRCKIWAIAYLCLISVNVLKIDIFIYVNKLLELLPGDSINSRLSLYLTREYSVNEEQTNMLAPYILLQSLTCFVTLFNIKRLQVASPYAILWVKSSFISIFIYSLSIPGVSMRLAELLSVSQIFLMSMIIDCFTKKYKPLGAIFVSIISFMWLSYFVLIKDFLNLSIS